MNNNFEETNCNFCGYDQTDILFTSKDRMYNFLGEFNLVKCKKCGLAYINPRPNINYIKNFYPENNYYSYSSKDKKSFVFKLREEIIKKYYANDKNYKIKGLLRRILAFTLKNKVSGIPKFIANGKIIDIGCGAGELLITLKDIGWKTYGVEISENAIKRGACEGIVIKNNFSDNLDFSDNYFDVARIWHVLEYTHDPNKTLREINRVLKHNGQLIIGIPVIDSLPYYLFKKYWFGVDSPRHLYLFNKKVILKMIEKNNFKIKSVKYDAKGGIINSLFYLLRDKFKLKFKKSFSRNIFWFFFELICYSLLDKIKKSDGIEIIAVKI